MSDVTLHDVYERLGEMSVQFTKSIGEVNVQLAKMNGRVTANAQTSGDHEDRIRSMEKWRYAVPSSVVLAVGSVVTALLT